MGSVPDIVSAEVQLGPEWWMRAAQSAVRHECGWHVAPSFRETLRLDGYGGRQLLLPSKHVTEVHQVTVEGRDVTDAAYWSESGTLELGSGVWPNLPGVIQVDLTHGWAAEDVPEVAALMLTIAKRAKALPGVASQSVNGASVSYATAGGAPLSVPLLQIERDMLAPYRLNWSV